jgi:hypothetical protein
MPDSDSLITRMHALLDRLERLLPADGPAAVPDAAALRWHADRPGRGLRLLPHAGGARLDQLQCVDRQKAVLERNTRQFLAGLPANHALLWGPRGTGKSSLVRALFLAHRDEGLRLVDVAQRHLADLQEICALLGGARGRFLVFCDDLSFAADDDSFRALKSVVDGSAAALPDNVLIYATSNRRHLIPEYMQENLASHIEDGELHLSEAAEEKLSLSERFGIWVAFHPFTQEQYLHIVGYWVRELAPRAAADAAAMERAALQWALERGTRSGRSAWQFARDWAGRNQLKPA